MRPAPGTCKTGRGRSCSPRRSVYRSVPRSEQEGRVIEDFPDLALHTFLVGTVFNLADWVTLDELWLGMMRPRRVIPAGLDPDKVAFEHARHFRGFLRGSVLSALIGAVIALCVRLV
jgi:hypothetical protein